MNKSSSYNVWVGLSFLTLGLILGLLITQFSQNGPMGQDSNPTGIGGAPSAQAPQAINVSLDDDPIMGEADAPITMIEFSNYQCGFCRLFHTQTFSEIQEKYIDTGLVRFVYRDFAPETGYPQARLAAQAAECVDEQAEGDVSYFDMNKMIFENTSEWSGNSEAASVFTAYADELGYDITSCLENQDMLGEIEDDYIAGRSYGVRGTPTFFINGKALVGAQDWEVFDAVLTAELESLGY